MLEGTAYDWDREGYVNAVYTTVDVGLRVMYHYEEDVVPLVWVRCSGVAPGFFVYRRTHWLSMEMMDSDIAEIGPFSEYILTLVPGGAATMRHLGYVDPDIIAEGDRVRVGLDGRVGVVTSVDPSYRPGSGYRIAVTSEGNPTLVCTSSEVIRLPDDD